MEQVYYTQCPMGYGLGAAGGFQLKRMSQGYPRAADFRHLGMRVQMSGLNVVSPKALRYRREGGLAEVAWLAPRPREFEVATADGAATRLYGRPGGLFAHGLRLDAEAMHALNQWPASLYDWPLWVERDPVPTAGRFLEPLELTDAALALRRFVPRFGDVAALAAPWDVEFLAGLLASLAAAMKSGRTLFLIDAPGPPEATAIGPLIALLTFAFPAGMREELTFSTHHDRPEGLPGFRIHATNPLARPDRAALRALGILADLGSRTIDAPPPPRWARRLATWLVERDELAWEETFRNLVSGVSCSESRQRWDDDWLDQLIHFRDRNTWAPLRLAEKESRREWHGAAEWAFASNLACKWSEAHPPTWWKAASEVAVASNTVASILLLQGHLGQPWLRDRGPGQKAVPDANQARAWGDVMASWFGLRSMTEWFTALKSFLTKMPAAYRKAFVQALNEASPERADATLDALERARALDPAALLTLRGLRALKPAVLPERLADVLAIALADEAAMIPVLDTLVGEVAETATTCEAIGMALAVALCAARSRDDPERWEQQRLRLFTWALDQPIGPQLLAEHLVESLADDDGRASFRALFGRIPTLPGHALLNAALEATSRRTSSEGAFRWLVEAVLLVNGDDGTIPPTRWAEPYLSLFDSDVPIYLRLFAPSKKPRLREWLAQADRVGDLSEAQTHRLQRIQAFRAVLIRSASRDLGPLLLLEVKDEERPWLLRTVLEARGQQSLDAAVACLTTCQADWPLETFHRPSGRRMRLAVPIAESLFRLGQDSEPSLGPSLEYGPWLTRLERVLDALCVATEAHERYRGDSLAAAIIAATSHLEAMKDLRWTFRYDLLHDEMRYRTLAADIREDLRRSGCEDPAAVFEEWDDRLEVGTEGAAFLEVFLNACDDAGFLALAPRLAERLRTLPPLPWWESGSEGDDLRERFARVVPLRPFRFDEIFPILTWFEPQAILLAPVADQAPEWPQRGPDDLPALSAAARARWVIVEKLSELSARDWLQWSSVIPELEGLPITRLGAQDRYTLASWLIWKVAVEDARTFDVASLTDAFFRFGFADPVRIANWFERLPEATPGLKERIQARREFVERLAESLAAVQPH